MLREDSDSPGTAGAALPSFGDVEQHHRSSREIEAERERFGRVLPHQEYLQSLATLGHCLDGRFQIIELWLLLLLAAGLSHKPCCV